MKKGEAGVGVAAADKNIIQVERAEKKTLMEIKSW